MDAIERVADTDDRLGEVPVWCPRTRRLWWADGFGAALRCLDPATGHVERHALPEKTGSFALREAGGLLLAARSGLVLFDPATGETTPLGDPQADPRRTLLNDGRVDPAGRFWVGSMDRRLDRPSGQLFRVDPDHRWRVMHEGFFLANSLAFSPDAATMYLACSHRKLVWRFPFDAASGDLGAPVVFADTADLPGVPDGAAVDTDGCIWIARFGGGCVVRHRPDGTVERVVELPVSQVTACGFGGDDLSTLFLTTATFRMDDAARAAQPLAGSLLALRPGAQGIAQPRYRG